MNSQNITTVSDETQDRAINPLPAAVRLQQALEALSADELWRLTAITRRLYPMAPASRSN